MENKTIEETIIEHDFIFKYDGTLKVFDGVSTLNGFLDNLEKQSCKNPLYVDTVKYIEEGFEAFVEILIKLRPVNGRIGITDYEPTGRLKNTIAGTGINSFGETVLIHTKYQSKLVKQLANYKSWCEPLLAAYIFDGVNNHHVRPEIEVFSKRKFLIFTTSETAHFYRDLEFFEGVVATYGRTYIKDLVDGNKPFWDSARRAIKNSLSVVVKD
jgi:hypothetical protein